MKINFTIRNIGFIFFSTLSLALILSELNQLSIYRQSYQQIMGLLDLVIRFSFLFLLLDNVFSLMALFDLPTQKTTGVLYPEKNELLQDFSYQHQTLWLLILFEMLFSFISDSSILNINEYTDFIMIVLLIGITIISISGYFRHINGKVFFTYSLIHVLSVAMVWILFSLSGFDNAQFQHRGIQLVKFVTLFLFNTQIRQFSLGNSVHN